LGEVLGRGGGLKKKIRGDYKVKGKKGRSMDEDEKLWHMLRENLRGSEAGGKRQ